MFSVKGHASSGATELTSPESATGSSTEALYHGDSTESLARRALRSVKSTWLTISDWLTEWTPWILVISYWIVCTAIFVMCSEQAIEVFYYFYMIANLYIALVAAIESFLGLSPVRDARKAADKVDASNGKFPSADDDLPTMDMVMVAYLPNEKDIVYGQVMYALEELVYPRHKLRISMLHPWPLKKA